MPRRRTNRMAPARFARRPLDASAHAQALWRELRFAVVPAGGGGTQGGTIELLHQQRPTSGYATLAGEANGPAANTAAGAGVHFGLGAYMPTVAPFSAFAFLVRRDSSAAIQSLVGNGASGANGWTFQLNYGAGQIGLTRWGVGDTVSSTLGAVPNTGGQASCVAMSYDGSNVRFFLNGRYQTVASGGVNVAASNNLAVGKNNSSLTPLLNTSLHVVYVWGRTLSDGEMMALYRDPWAPIRPKSRTYDGSVVSTTIARVTQTAVEALIALPVQTRATQVLVEALIGAPATPSTARLSQLVVEAFGHPDPMARLTQLAVEVLSNPTPGVRVTQVDVEAWLSPVPTVRVTQVNVETLVRVATLSVPLTGQLFGRGSPEPF